MNRREFEFFTDSINQLIGNPQTTWEGPEPHDFRNMKERGVRFVHSALFSRLPGDGLNESDTEYAPDGKVYFKILVGDREATEMIMRRLLAVGISGRYRQYSSRELGAVEFEKEWP